MPRIIRIHANIAALRGATKEERLRIRQKVMEKYSNGLATLTSDSEVFSLMQDRTFPLDLCTAGKIMVIVVPEHNTMGGGIYSFFSIANVMRRLKPHHGHEIVVMTRPVPSRLTYFRNTNFRNSENVYRFEQILRCKSAKEVYLHIPEYAADFFAGHLSEEERKYFASRDNVHINILNQNIKLMPEKERFSGLRDIAGSLSQSVAHHAYFNQAIANKYDLPTLLLPAYTDLSAYPAADFDAKEKLIIYSPDEAPNKEACLEQISRNLPDFELIEIRDITFDRFMDYATRCMFSISFGEGFDGYLAQPIHQGGIGFTAYNEDFFPSPHFKGYYNIFEDERQMVKCICDRMAKLSSDRRSYVKLNEQFQEEYRKLYVYEDYVEQIRKLSIKQFEVFPQTRGAISAHQVELPPRDADAPIQIELENGRRVRVEPMAGASSRGIAAA